MPPKWRVDHFLFVYMILFSVFDSLPLLYGLAINVCGFKLWTSTFLRGQPTNHFIEQPIKNNMTLDFSPSRPRSYFSSSEYEKKIPESRVPDKDQITRSMLDGDHSRCITTKSFNHKIFFFVCVWMWSEIVSIIYTWPGEHRNKS